MSDCANPITPAALAGVWLAISHQTITVTAIRPDQTFSGTYFTPAANLRATFAGTWSLVGAELTLEYTESESPAFRVPMIDRNRLETVSPDSVILHTLPQGISLGWNRVQFAPHWSEGRRRNQSVNAPLPEELLKLTIDDLADQNPLSEWTNYLVNASSKALFDEKIIDALTHTIPKKAGYYYAITSLEGLWGNGGMQAVLLRDEIPQTQKFLKVAAAGYEHFGSAKVAALIRELAAKAIPWMAAIQALNEREAAEHEFDPIWAEIDGFDSVFDAVLQEDGPLDALLADIHQNPGDYTIAAPSA